MGVALPLVLPEELLDPVALVVVLDVVPVLDDTDVPVDALPELPLVEVVDDVELEVDDDDVLPEDVVSLLHALKTSAAVRRASVKLRLMISPGGRARPRPGAS